MKSLGVISSVVNCTLVKVTRISQKLCSTEYQAHISILALKVFGLGEVKLMYSGVELTWS